MELYGQLLRKANWCHPGDPDLANLAAMPDSTIREVGEKRGHLKDPRVHAVPSERLRERLAQLANRLELLQAPSVTPQRKGTLDSTSSQRPRIGQRERQLLFKDQYGKCMYCGKEMDLPYLEVDHKTPLAKKGLSKLSNLQLLCGPCNKRKGDLTDGEFRKQYKLTPAREAKGPPAEAIPQQHFTDMTKKRQMKRRRTSRRQNDDSD